MDWLSSYQAVIDCYRQRVTVCTLSGEGSGLCVDARGESGSLWLTSVENTREELPYTRPRVSSSDLCLEDKVELIRKRLVTAQSRQKSYADRRRRPLAFEVGDHVFLKISPRRGLMRFGKSGKLSPRFIGPFEILEGIGEVAYRLALPPQLSGVHDVFHVSMLRKYEPDPSHVLDWTDLEVDEDASYEERPVQVLDRRDQVL
ncbi:hypothetical protein CsSME_00010138 [Camellia sinensis var. sinensis]